MKFGFELKYVWDSDVMKQRVKCFFRHDWIFYQDCFTGDKYTVVIAWKVCKRCAESKLVHILK